MKKSIFGLLLIVPLLITAQFTIKGKLTPSDNFSWLLLYKIIDGKQIYLDNTEIKDSDFEFVLPESENTGVYRVFYQLENQLYVELIYNKEPIEFFFDPYDPVNSIEFLKSSDNIINQKYYKTISQKQSGLDSLQVVYFKTTDSKYQKKIEHQYKEKLKDVEASQSNFESSSEGKLANNFIRASRQFNPKKPLRLPETYIDLVKEHFFDAVDFRDTVLLNSTFISDKIMDYIFYLNQSDDPADLNQMQKIAINTGLSKVNDKSRFMKNMIESILDAYATEQNEEMVNFMLDENYKKLPSQYQDEALINHVLSEIKTALGKKSPNIQWLEDGKEKNLYDLEGSDYYIVVFFSSGCPHCQIELPEFHNFMKDVSNIKVIAVGLEDDENQWKEMTQGFDLFINILDLDKWESKKVRDFGFSNIPNYFILDKEKIIIAKPENVEELKQYFPN